MLLCYKEKRKKPGRSFLKYETTVLSNSRPESIPSQKRRPARAHIDAEKNPHHVLTLSFQISLRLSERRTCLYIVYLLPSAPRERKDVCTVLEIVPSRTEQREIPFAKEKTGPELMPKQKNTSCSVLTSFSVLTSSFQFSPPSAPTRMLIYNMPSSFSFARMLVQTIASSK